MLLAKPALNFPDGPWITLLEKAYSLFDSVASDGFTIPRWSLGGGTVLMFHYAHRRSKDIDIFIPDPQFLGYINLGLVAVGKILRPSTKILRNT